MSIQAYHSQESSQEPALLRGYDPVKECVQWNILAGFLAGTLLFMSFISSPSVMNGTWPAGEIQTSFSVLAIAALFLLACAAPVLPLWIRARREERQRNSWRRDALQRTDPRLVSPQPVAPEWPLNLPSHLEGRVHRALFTVIGAAGLIVISFFVSGYLWASGYPGEFLRTFVEWFALIMAFIPLLYLGFVHLIQMYIAAHYFHPQLHIDNDGITARYGHDTITMAWSDIRYFALINSKLSSAGFNRKAPWREAFEISDGENRVCWLAHQPLSSYRLFSLDDTDFGELGYAKFTQQLAVLIMERTRLPLLDFRQEETKQKKQANPSQKRETTPEKITG